MYLRSCMTWLFDGGGSDMLTNRPCTGSVCYTREWPKTVHEPKRPL